MAIDACYTGSWYDTKRDGEGINIEVLEDLTVAYFYTFDKGGNQVWYTLIGDKILTMHQTVIVEDPDEFITKTVLVGEAEIEVLTNDEIFYQFNIVWGYVDGKLKRCTGDRCEGKYLYRRITQPIPCMK